MTDVDLQDRVAELEQRAQRLVLAGDGRDQGGWGAWHNLLETRLMQERDSFSDIVSHALALFERKIIDDCKALIADKLRVCGTYDAKKTYAELDIVALDGGSFVARKDKPGKCPGPDWQLWARQGQRGVAGERGVPGRDAPRIVGWVVDRGAFTVAPKLSDGSTGPLLELRELFAPAQDEGAA
jgi:hypothetical protein